MYICKDKCLKKHNKNLEVPEGWNEITLSDWNELKKTWQPILSEEEIEIKRQKQVLKRKLNVLDNWFKANDYIELQASRGTIERNSEKYLNYLNEYNLKLEEYKEIKEQIK